MIQFFTLSSVKWVMRQFLIWAIIVLSFKTSAVLGKVQDACATKLCRCSDHLTEANCHHTNLTYVPLLPKTITRFHFIGNFLPHITKESLVNLTGIHIKDFEYRFDHTHTIDITAFDVLKKVKILDVSYNNLSTDSLYSFFTEILHRFLENIYLKGNGIKTIPPDICRQIKKSRVEMIDLSFNSLTVFNFTNFGPLVNLKNLKLNNNKLTTFFPTYNSSLLELDLFGNKISDLSPFCSNDDSFPMLTSLNLRNNSIDHLNPKHLACLKKLATLDLSMNYLGILVTNSFQMLPLLQLLSINSQKNQQSLEISARTFNNKRLKTLFLRNNLLRTNRVDAEAFEGCNNITQLDLSSNALYMNQEKLNEILTPLESLQFLNLYRSQLTRVPSVIGRMKKLQKLFMAANFLTEWTADQFINNTELKELNINSNSIQTITMDMFPDYLKDRLNKIDFRTNALVCNCDIVWFIQWMRRQPNKFIGYPKGYTCLKITERVCLKNTAVFISMTTITCAFIVILLATSIVYKHRWIIKYHIYMWRYRPIKMRNITEKHFDYDVFVSYCFQDSDWVVNQLLPAVEGGEGLKLCIHERDFDGGRLIIDNIIHYMNNSRKVLFVLSNDFARSEWCQYEVSLALRLVLDMSIESLVVVLLENVDTENMTRSLNALLKTTTYITWDENVDEQVLWTRLADSLRARNLDNVA